MLQFGKSDRFDNQPPQIPTQNFNLQKEVRCSFCAKENSEGVKIIAGPKEGPQVYICDDCVEVCNQILSSTSQ